MKPLMPLEGRLRIHDLRHTTAVRLREKGTPLETIMGIMRHADIRETLIYAPYDLTEGQKAILALDD
jgi:integrase